MKNIAILGFLIALACLTSGHACTQALSRICPPAIPTGYVVVDESITPTSSCDSGTADRWQVERYSTEPAGATINFCEPVTGIRSGWFVISFTSDPKCKESSSPTAPEEPNAFMVMENYQGLAVGTTLNICAGINTIPSNRRIVGTVDDSLACNPDNGGIPPFGSMVKRVD